MGIFGHVDTTKDNTMFWANILATPCILYMFHGNTMFLYDSK